MFQIFFLIACSIAHGAPEVVAVAFSIGGVTYLLVFKPTMLLQVASGDISGFLYINACMQSKNSHRRLCLPEVLL
jgi:hypothetical protein